MLAAGMAIFAFAIDKLVRLKSVGTLRAGNKVFADFTVAVLAQFTEVKRCITVKADYLAFHFVIKVILLFAASTDLTHSNTIGSDSIALRTPLFAKLIEKILLGYGRWMYAWIADPVPVASGECFEPG